MLKIALIKIAKFVFIFSLIMVLTQDIHIFPRAFLSVFSSKNRDPKTIPSWVQASFIETEDKKRLEVWYVPSNQEVQDTGKIAILFHGNGDHVDNFVGLQTWFASIGVSSYSFDYRGFGNSTGWPSEKGLFRDSDAVWKHVREQTEVPADDIIVVGFSLGCAMAAQLAADKEVGSLVLLSPYVSLPEVIKDRPIFRPLVPFLWYKLPTRDFVSDLKKTNLIIAHGKLDEIIPFRHYTVVRDAYQGSGQLLEIVKEDARHNDLFWKIREELAQKINSLL